MLESHREWWRSTFPNRATLCALGYHPLPTMVWRTSRGTTVPTHHYWTEDILNYTGTGTGMCSAEYATRGSPDQFFGGCGDTAGVVCMTGP